AFQQIAARSGGQRAENFFGIFKNSEHHHLRVAHLRLQMANAFYSAHAAEIDVHQDYVGFFLRQLDERFLGAAVDADALEAFGGVHVTSDVLAQVRFVIDDGNSNWLVHFLLPLVMAEVSDVKGMLRITVVPWLGWLRTVHCPPRRSSLWR